MSQESRGNSQYLKTTILLANVVMNIRNNAEIKLSWLHVKIASIGSRQINIKRLELKSFDLSLYEMSHIKIMM